MYQKEEPEINLEQLLERLRSFGKRLRIGGGGGIFAVVVFGILGLALVIWLATGFYTVQPGEQAALRRLGAFDGIQGPGLHWFWPAPIGTRNTVQVEEVRRLELGVRGATPVLSESLMISGDENLVDVQLLVQYDIKDLEQFLFKVVDPAGITIKDVAETALRQVVGARDIDDVLTIEKEAVQIDTRTQLQALLDDYQTGINVREVKLLNVFAPQQVKDAFDDVVIAKEEKERVINLADAYKEAVLPRARGEAARLRETAEGFRQERVAIATGQAERFVAILEEYNKSKEVTRQRLYLEAMEDVLSNIQKFIVANDAGGSLLQFLPLTDTTLQSPTSVEGQP